MLQGQRLGKADYRILPWKNGLGFTTEYGIEPAGANFASDPFLWRISSARVAAPGPFSLFAGYERLIAVVRGGNMILRYDESDRSDELRIGTVHRFSGDLQTRSELPEGEIEDFNLIMKRGACEGELHVHRNGDGAPRLVLQGDWIWTFCIDGVTILETPGGDCILESGESFLHEQSSAPLMLSSKTSSYNGLAITAVIRRI
jgi:environmental stress-induced protein Ves